MAWQLPFWLSKRLPQIVIFGLLLITVLQLYPTPAFSDRLGSRTLNVTNSVSGGVSNYKISFDISTVSTLGSMLIQFCTLSPNIDDPCIAPIGFSASGATLVDQTGQTGFSLSAGSTINSFILGRTAAPDTVGPVSYSFNNVVNPRDAGSYFVRIRTYASGTGSGNASDYGAIAFAINSDLTISAEVPPYLIFCTGVSIPDLQCTSAAGDYINFGELSAVRPILGTSQILSGSNAKSGYNVSLSGTTLTSGNNAITALAVADVSRPGTPQFGLNLRANASPNGGSEPNGPGGGSPIGSYNSPNFYSFNPGDVIITTSKPDEMRRFTASYLVNVPKSQAPGVYVSTVTYICLGNF